MEKIVCPNCGPVDDYKIVEDPKVKLCFKTVQINGVFYFCARCGHALRQQ
ncbi:MAG: hypothetical protein ACXQTD_00975 [Candidatus Syntropharchaeia archaeon]